VFIPYCKKDMTTMEISLGPRKVRLYGVVLILVSLIISIALGEIVLRLITSEEYYVWPPGLRKIFRPAPGIMPGIEGESRFFINEYGIRGDPRKMGDVHKIITFSLASCIS